MRSHSNSTQIEYGPYTVLAFIVFIRKQNYLKKPNNTHTWWHSLFKCGFCLFVLFAFLAQVSLAGRFPMRPCILHDDDSDQVLPTVSGYPSVAYKTLHVLRNISVFASSQREAWTTLENLFNILFYIHALNYPVEGKVLMVLRPSPTRQRNSIKKNVVFVLKTVKKKYNNTA